MHKVIGFLLLAACSCAHGPAVKFTDDSADSEVGWVCVPKDKDHWNCVDIRTFAQYLRDAEPSRTDM